MKSQNVYIGNSSCNGIYHYKLMNGSLVALGNLCDIEKCTYLCKKDNMIYGVIENVDGEIFSYNIESEEIKKVKTKKSCPCHISISDDGKYIFVSHYKDGYKQIYEVKPDGTIGKLIFNEVQDAKKSHTHFMKEYNKNLYSVDLGTGCIEVFGIKYKINSISKIDLGEDIQPRHLCFYKNVIFVITEKSCKLYTLKFDNDDLSIVESRELLPEEEEMKNTYTGCAIDISKDGKYIYATIREHNSISVFKNTNGVLKLIQNISSEGELPWDIKVDKDGKYVIVANASSDDVCIFERNKFNGKLKYMYKSSMNAPSCILID
ncbi:MAG: beta-propeller fold lactonase family protein [Clostridia bacterium]|nr:beta-propeller fold lactonase family protein [Clostridia bacterium]